MRKRGQLNPDGTASCLCINDKPEKDDMGGEWTTPIEKAQEDDNGEMETAPTECLPASEDKSNEKAAAAKPKELMVSFLQLFSFAEKYDYFLMFVGGLGSAVHGASLPVIVFFLGKLLNGIGQSITDAVDTIVYGSGNLRRAVLSCLTIVLTCTYGLKVVRSFMLLTMIESLVACRFNSSNQPEVAFWMHTGERQSAKLREIYLQALLRQDVAYFDTETSTGDIVNSLAADPLTVQDAIGEKTGHFIHFVATCLTSFVVGFLQEWRMAIATLAILPAVALPAVISIHYHTRLTANVAVALSEAGAISQQAVSQVRTVYSFVAEEKFVESYSKALKQTTKLGIKVGLVKGLAMGTTAGVVLFSFAVLLTYGGIIIRKGDATGGTILASLLNIVVGSVALASAMPSLISISNARVAAFKIMKVIHHEPVINKPDENAEILTSVDGHIELRDVDFSYPSRPDAPIFEKFSLIIPSGKIFAIVGSSGSGKSTVVSLIERFYDPTAGEVLLDGHNLRNLDLRWLRRQLGLVNQEPALFATTIAANIAYGNDTASQQEIEEAAKVANAHVFIDQLPQKYQTQVGERGVQLSGGQRQRIAIARALVKNPKVLLLDEATSALDASSEKLVQKALDRIMVGRTTVVVAHRLSTIRNADTIAVAKHGRIVESGTHQDLMLREHGAYAALVRLQEMAITTGNSVLEDSNTLSYIGHSQRFSEGFKSSHRVSCSPGLSVSFRDISHSMRHLGNSFRSHRSRGSAASIDLEDFAADLLKQPEESPEPVASKPGRSMGFLQRLIVMTKCDWPYGVAAVIGSGLVGTLSPLQALILGEVVSDYFSTDYSFMKRDLLKYTLLNIGLGVAAVPIHTLQNSAIGVVGERLVNRVRKKLFATILRNELGWFDKDENDSSQIAARLSSDAATVRSVIADRSSIILSNITLLLLTWSLSLAIQWKVALVMIAMFPLMVFSPIAEQQFLAGFAGDQAKAYVRAVQVAGEAVSNIRTVAAFAAEDKVEALFAKELIGPSRERFLRGHAAGLGYGIAQAVFYASEALGLWYAAKLVAAKEASFGQVIKAFLISLFSLYAAADALTLAPDVAKGGQAIESIFETLDRVTKIDSNDPEGEKAEKIRGEIELKEVTMAYPSRPDVVVLKGMNLKVNPGLSLALVGASGSGKSSIIALIERFYDPQIGQVLIDGKDIKKYNLQTLRQHIALVQQDPVLFSCTVYENILYGKPGASEAEVIEAAKAANAHEFVSALPEGYKTQVGERGVQLSGGQKQRVSIARAVLNDPAIFLLDEATSALDAESEKVVQEAIDRVMKTRTTVIVAHRLTTIRGADSIAVVQDGKVVEKGSHASLLEDSGGTYSRLIRLQGQMKH